MRYVRCGNPNCGVLIEQKPGSGKWYHSNACRQEAYRLRKKKKEPLAKITFERYCVNCGKTFTTTRVLQQFHNTSCRVSFHQNKKRVEKRFQELYGDKTDEQ